MALPDRAANILPLLANEARLKSGYIAFIAHSLGGLVVEETLRLAEVKAPHDSIIADFLRRVRRVAFIGTPHLGSGYATVSNTLSWLTLPRATTKGLSRNDPYLRALNQWFRSYTETHGIEALVLRETKSVRILGSRLLDGLVVPPDSADPGLSPRTHIIPLDEDHCSIVAPSSKNAEVYKHLLSFVARPVDTLAADQLLSSRLDSVRTIVGVQSRVIEELRAEVIGSNEQVIAVLGEFSTHLRDTPQPSDATAGADNMIVTAAAEHRVELLRKCRFLGEFDAQRECKQLFNDLSHGELIATSKAFKGKAYAWCARIRAAADATDAREMLERAALFGGGDEYKIARAFLLLFQDGDKHSAAATLASIDTPMARSAAFLVAAHNEAPTAALKWAEQAGLRTDDLDAEGKFAVIKRQVEAGEWAAALMEVSRLTDSDFAETPVLLSTAAGVHLAHAVPVELREELWSHLPVELKDYPLGIDAESLAHRQHAERLFEQATAEFRSLNLNRTANHTSDYALWLRLSDPIGHPSARRELEASLSDPAHALRRVPFAIQYGVSLDVEAVEREIARQSALSGGKLEDAAVARFALALSKKDPKQVAAYIEQHRAQLVGYYTPNFIALMEVEALARAGDVADARDKLNALSSESFPIEILQRVSRLLDEASAAHPISAGEERYKETRSLADLTTLVNALKSKREWPKLAEYGKLLFERIKDLDSAEIFRRSLHLGRDLDLIKLADDFPEFSTRSRAFATTLAWAYYRSGDLVAAKAILRKLQASRDDPNDRALALNIAVASGDWSTLSVIVESEWERRAERTAKELLRAGQLAQRIGSFARSQDLIRQAAATADSDPEVLIGCYGAATTGGWENDPVTSQWFQTAIQASTGDGPVKAVSIRELVEMQPSWNERQNRTWDHLISGRMPMFGAAAGTQQLASWHLPDASAFEFAGVGSSPPQYRSLLSVGPDLQGLSRPPI